MCRYMQHTRHFFKLLCRHFSKRTKQIKGSAEPEKLPIFEYPVASETDRRLYAWGLAETGALGVSEPKTSRKSFSSVVTHPTRIGFGEKYTVGDVSCGYGFTLFAVRDKNSKLFGTGINTDSQLGYQEQRKDGALECLTYPAPIALPLAEPATNVVSITSGRAHSIVLTDREGAFTIGNNSYGQCGRPINKKEIYGGSKALPFAIPNLGNEQITAVHCGQDHSLFLNKSGKVFSCGWGADGQTGLGHYRNEHVPTQVLGDIASEHITKVAGIADCVLAINDKGEVFGWGNSEYGQLSQGSGAQQINTPRHLPFCRTFGRIVDIATGGSFCGIVNDQGEVFVWGFGILGKGPEIEHSFMPTPIPPVLFGKNEYNPNVFVTSINCGLSHFVALTNHGDVYTWGRNRHACLGLGHYNNQFFPFKVAIGARAVKVSCGIDHNVVLCKPHL